MDLRKIKKLIELVQETGIAELEVRTGDEKVRIAQAMSSAPAVAVSSQSEPATTVEEGGANRAVPGSVMSAPMAGTFYRAPAPGEKPFVEVGDTVAAGDVLCIIESMKMMNKVESDFAGQIADVLVDNGKPIESGAGLFRIV